MKKIFLSLILGMAVCVAASAQTTMLGSNGLALDTVSNTGTETLTARVKESGAVTIVLTVTKISGTVGGTATIHGSLDGVDYAPITTAYTVTDGTQTTEFEFDRRRYVFYRVSITGTGTMSASVKAKIIVN